VNTAPLPCSLPFLNLNCSFSGDASKARNYRPDLTFLSTLHARRHTRPWTHKVSCTSRPGQSASFGAIVNGIIVTGSRHLEMVWYRGHQI
jgi:hypothetical protein